MSKNRNRTKFDAQGNPISSKKKSQAPVTETERVHRPKIERPHLAQELRDRGLTEEAENATRRLFPHLRGRAQGLKDTHYRYPGLRTTNRRDVIGGQSEA